MRVLYVEMAFGFGGSLTGILHLVNHLPPEVEPVLVTSFDARQLTSVPDRLQYEVATIPQLARDGGSKSRKLKQFFRQHALPWQREVAALVRKYRPDVIHTANSVFTNAPAAFVGRRRGIPVVGYEKGFEYDGRLSRFVIKRGWYSMHVASSEAVAERLFSLGVAPERCTVMYEPVEPPNVTIRTANGKPPVVAIYSILQPWKGQDVFLRAIGQVIQRFSQPFRVVIAGTAPDVYRDYPEQLKTLTAELGLSERVEFRGHVSDVFGMLSETDIAVHASVKPEPFGRVIAEAMSSGVAVVATQGGGAAEIVQHDQTGLHVPMGDVDAMAGAIERLLRNHDLRQTLGRNAREFALREFRPQSHAHQIVSLYQNLIDSRRRGNSR